LLNIIMWNWYWIYITNTRITTFNSAMFFKTLKKKKIFFFFLKIKSNKKNNNIFPNPITIQFIKFSSPKIKPYFNYSSLFDKWLLICIKVCNSRCTAFTCTLCFARCTDKGCTSAISNTGLYKFQFKKARIHNTR